MTGSTPHPSTGSSRSQRPGGTASSTRWTFPYAAAGAKAVVHPAIPAFLQGPGGGQEFPIIALLDSGADGSCFPEVWAEVLGVDLSACKKRKVQTGNGEGHHFNWHEPLTLTVEGIKFPVRATFGPVGVAILGRSDFFEHFYVEIDEKAKVTHIRLHAVPEDPEETVVG